MDSAPSKNRKKLDLDRVFIDVIKLLLVKNPEQISYSLVAKKTGVPRSTLYYYFGRECEQMILLAVRFVMRDFMQVWETAHPALQNKSGTWTEMQQDRFLRALKLVAQSPWILQFYFRYCNHSSVVGREIQRLEALYLKSVAKEWKAHRNGPLPDSHLHLLTHLKLGVLWGLSSEKSHWRNKEEDLAAICVRVFALFEEL